MNICLIALTIWGINDPISINLQNVKSLKPDHFGGGLLFTKIEYFTRIYLNDGDNISVNESIIKINKLIKNCK